VRFTFYKCITYTPCIRDAITPKIRFHILHKPTQTRNILCVCVCEPIFVCVCVPKWAVGGGRGFSASRGKMLLIVWPCQLFIFVLTAFLVYVAKAWLGGWWVVWVVGWFFPSGWCIARGVGWFKGALHFSAGIAAAQFR